MSTIHQTLHTGPDGVLKLEVPTGMANTDVAVTVLIEPAKPRPARDTAAERQKFIDATAGKWQGEPLQRGDQGIAEVRNSLD